MRVLMQTGTPMALAPFINTETHTDTHRHAQAHTGTHTHIHINTHTYIHTHASVFLLRATRRFVSILRRFLRI